MGDLVGKNNKKRYTLLKELGSGGEGTVYSINGDPNRVIKIYKDPKPDLITKLTKMVQSKLGNSSDVAFPEELVYEGTRFRGYVMKVAHGEAFSKSYASSSKGMEVSQEIRIYLAINLTIALINIHEEGFVFGDFNPANIKYDQNRRTVTLIDTDSFIFDSYGGIVARPEVVPWEIRDAMKQNESLSENRKKNLPFSKESDTYTLAVHVFRLLMNGAHPFNYKATTSLYESPMYAYEFKTPTFPYVENNLRIAPPPFAIPLESLPLELQTLFVRMFREGYKDKSIRPSAEEILDELKNYLNELKSCSSNKDHKYWKSLKSCPYCEANKRMANSMRGMQVEPVRVSTIQYVYTVDYEDVLRSPEKLKLLENAVKQGKAKALLALGRLYSDGLLVKQDNEEAFDLWMKASTCNKPEPEAQYRLALCYLDGIGTEVSKSDAIKWLDESSKNKYGPAKEMLKYISSLNPKPTEKSSKKKEPVQQQTSAVPNDQPTSDQSHPKITINEAYRHLIVLEDWDWREISPYLVDLKAQAAQKAESAYMFAVILHKMNPRDPSVVSYLKKASSDNYCPAIEKLAELNKLNTEPRQPVGNVSTTGYATTPSSSVTNTTNNDSNKDAAIKARQGDRDAQLLVADYYINHKIDLANDENLLLICLKTYAESKYTTRPPDCYAYLAQILANKNDTTAALALFNEAANLGNSAPMVEYYIESGNKPDYNDDFFIRQLLNYSHSLPGSSTNEKYYNLAVKLDQHGRYRYSFNFLYTNALNGHTDSMKMLSDYYRTGRGTTQNTKKAQDWMDQYKKATTKDVKPNKQKKVGLLARLFGKK